jgi:hypothetical protein
MRRRSPRSACSNAQSPGSLTAASPSSASSPTTGRPTRPTPGETPAPDSGSATNGPAPTAADQRSRKTSVSTR